MRKKYIRYNVTMAILSLIIAIILIIQLTLDLSYEVELTLSAIDFIIWCIFVIDYMIRLKKSRNKKKFIRRNLIDLVAITPFYSIFKTFRVLKILRITKLAKLSEFSKIIRVVAIIRRSNKNLSELMKTNNFNYTIIIAIIIVFLGSVIMSYVENISLSSAMWWSIVTFTTVGYGDIYPKTGIGKVIASIFMIMGIGFIGSTTSTISTYFIKKEENRHESKKKNLSNSKENKSIVNDEAIKDISKVKQENKYQVSVINDIIQKLGTFDELTKQEVETICKILKSLK